LGLMLFDAALTFSRYCKDVRVRRGSVRFGIAARRA